MFLGGPFLTFPFLAFDDFPEDPSDSAMWNRMLNDPEVKITYTVEIEPWVLADRS